MTRRLRDGNSIALRAIVAAGAIAAFLFTLVLSAAPQLHERIHHPTGATHECAVTLLSSGNCMHAPSDTITIGPPPVQQAARYSAPGSQLLAPRLEFLLLEHAPPAIS